MNQAENALDYLTVMTVLWVDAPLAKGRIYRIGDRFGWMYFDGRTGSTGKTRNFTYAEEDDAITEMDRYHYL